MGKIKRDEAITLVALTITIIVIIILASISITEGTRVIKRAKVESFVTNMITIRANAKVYAEEVNAKTWTLNSNEKEELFKNEYYMTKGADIHMVSQSDLDIELSGEDTYEAYSVGENALKDMGLENIKDDANYIVVYNSNDYTKLDVVYKEGIVYDGTEYYTLSKLKEAIEN